MANSGLGTALTVAGLVTVGYVGYKSITSGIASSTSVGTDIGNAIGTAINDIASGAISAAKAAIKRAGGSLTELTIGGVVVYAVIGASGQVLGYIIKSGAQWIFSSKPPSGSGGTGGGGGTGGTPPTSPPTATAPVTQPSPTTAPTTSTAPTAASHNPFVDFVNALISARVTVPNWVWSHLVDLAKIGAISTASLGLLISLAKAAGQAIPATVEAAGGLLV